MGNFHKGQTVKDELKEKEVKQEDLATAIGVSRTYLNSLLNKAEWKKEHWDKAVNFLDIKSNDIVINQNEHLVPVTIVNDIIKMKDEIVRADERAYESLLIALSQKDRVIEVQEYLMKEKGIKFTTTKPTDHSGQQKARH